MSKELVISAASHERRVAILEEGQLVEIYIEREKEFALVGSIYKGKVTRVLPGMQSAFVDIGLDGDAFLYVSDVFENLEDYDHGQGHEEHLPLPPRPAAPELSMDVLPGESLARAGGSREVTLVASDTPEAHENEATHEEIHSANAERPEEHQGELAATTHADGEVEPTEQRQPDSNASAPQNFAPHYNPTQNYPARGGSGQNYGRGSDQGGERSGGERVGGDGGRGRFGRRGGRRRGGRPPGPGGRNLPPSKYASPQGAQSGESRGYDQRGAQPRGFEPRGPDQRGGEQRGFENRRPDNIRSGQASTPPDVGEEPILLPGESLAKYRGKSNAASSSAIVDNRETPKQQPEAEASVPATSISGGGVSGTGVRGAGATNVPRRFSGGLPRWLLADASSESEAAAISAEENIGVAQDSSTSAHGALAARHEASPLELPIANADKIEHEAANRSDVELSEDQVAALASGFIEAKQEETQEEVEAPLVGGDEVEEEESEAEHLADPSELTEEETEEVEEDNAAARAEAEADAAHESAEHAAALGEDHGVDQEIGEHASSEPQHLEESVTSEASAEERVSQAATIQDDVILLPGETRSPRSGGAAPREDFPRDSARVGGNPRSRFQRPFRSGGRDRGKDSRGGRPERGGRPSGPRFERRPSGGPRHDRGHQGSHSGASRRPHLISEMLKAGQDIIIQIAKKPLGKKGARITSHVALPGRFLVYMPTIDHIGVSRKIASADNRSRLRRLVGEARGAYPGGFIVRTAAGGASDEEIRTDIEFLGRTWNEIKERSEQRKSPALLHRDLNLVERILRDYVSDDFTAIWIDSEEEYGKVVEFVSRFQPKLVNRVKFYTKEQPIFEEFGIQHELDKALRAKVWLKSGGYIVINHTEALVAIDVNTGKFVGKGSTRLEDTIVKTNLEAVKEIVRQIRLRDLGGIIVVDFIDMEERRNREKVLVALQQALEQDKAPSKALSFNEFGLVCITRKRTKQALERVLCQPCPYCTGSGMVKSIPTLCYEIQAEARKMAMAGHEGPNLTLRVHPEIAKALKTRESLLMHYLEQTSHKHIIIQSDATLHWEQYDIY